MNMGQRADLIVAGAGPAGLAAAIDARLAGMQVVVLDPRAAPIDKACGEGLMPAAMRHLRELGVEEPAGFPFEGICYRDAADPSLSAMGSFRGPGARGVRRTELSRVLFARAHELGVTFVERPLRTWDARADGVEAEGWRARFLIAADGLRSPVRRRLGLERPSRLPPRFGSRRHHRIEPWSTRVEVYFARGIEAYVTPVAADQVGVAFLRSADLPHDDPSLAAFPDLARRLARAEVITHTRGAGPFEQRVARRVEGPVLLVGDAAGYLDPLTGEGVALGIAGARAAVGCIVAGQPEAYELAYRRLTRRYYTLTTALLELARRRALHRPMIALAARLPAVFDQALAYLDEAA